MALKIAALLVATALLAEGAFRLVHRVRPIFFFPDDSYNQFRARPGLEIYGFPVNSRGFRDVETDPDKPEGTYRILGIGDSFAFGVVPYENNYLTLLEEKLDRGRGRVEVVNMGIPRANVEDYLALLVQEGLGLEPDMVLLSFFVGNDFKPPPPRRTPARRSYLLAFLRYAFQIRPQFEGKVHEGLTYEDDRPTFNRRVHYRVLRSKLTLFHRGNAELPALVERAASYLARIRDLAAERGAPLFVVILPDEIQVEMDTRREIFALHPRLRPARYDFDAPNRLLRRSLDELGIPHLDLLSPLRHAAAHRGPVYKPRDTHWNLLGNAIAAEHIHRALAETGGVP